jgi:hypothetical protein
MSKAKAGPGRTRATADPDALFEKARGVLERESAMKLSSLGPPALRPELVARLVQEGYEATKTTLRKPIKAQLMHALADGAFISLKSAASQLVGASSTDAKAAALGLVAAGKAKLVLRGTEEVVVPPDAPTLSSKELIALGGFVKRVAKAIGSKTGTSLLLADVAEEIGPFLHSPAIGKTALRPTRVPVAAGTQGRAPFGSPMNSLLSAVDATRDPRTGLSFVPAIVARLKAELDSARVSAALLEAARNGLLELRPEGGIQRLSREELLVCPPGPQGTRLSWARRPDRLEASR